MKERTVHADVTIVANEQSPEVAQPGDASFHLPSPAVTPQLPSVLRFGFSAVDSMGTDQLNPSLFQAISQRIGIGGTIINQPRRFAPRSSASASWNGNRLQRFLNLRDFIGRGRVEVNSQRNTLAVDHPHPLCTVAAFGFSDACAPFLPKRTSRRRTFLPSSIGRRHRVHPEMSARF